MPVKPALIPNLRYQNAAAAIDFLCDAFGFERHAVYADKADPSLIHHAELVRDGNMVMLSTAVETSFSKLAGLRTVKEAGGNTHSLYLTLDDVDSHAEHARSVGAEILMQPADQDYGGRGYTARDPEGYLWSFGSYDPFAKSKT